MRFLRILAFALFSIAAAHGQLSYSTSISDPNDKQRYTLSGTVVNSVTGEPIRRALVTMFFQQQAAVMTDFDGHFEFEGLPRMRTTVTAQKPGFFNDQELTAGRRRSTQFDVGPDGSTVVIRLVPEAIITGRIVDPDGLPVRGLNIRALTQRVMNGRKEWQQGTFARTDADGIYRISNLMPGSYFLIAGPGRAPAFVTGTEDASELGYPAITYPSATAPMRINAGQQVEANFAVKPEPFYSVSGSVSGIVPGIHFSVQLIPVLPGPRIPMFGASPDQESGTFTIPRVAPGDYILQTQGAGRDRNTLQGSMSLTVRRNLMGVTISLDNTLTIPIHVRDEQTKGNTMPVGMKNVPRFQLTLTPFDQNGPGAFTMHENPKDPDSPLVLKNARPGRYRVQMMSSFGNGYVASARLGTTDLLNGEVTLGSSANQGTIDVVIRDDAARLIVKLRTDEEKQVTVLVLPDRGEPRLSEASANPNGGEVHMGGLRPGAYTVLVFDDLGDLEYMNRDALEPYLSRGAKVMLGPNQESTVSPDLIKRGRE
jgi:hypothetical protein